MLALPPDIIVYPESTEEVAEIVRLCAAERVPIIPHGAGTSLDGHLAAVRGGVSLDLTRMNRILRQSTLDLDATVEAGVTRLQLARSLNPDGATFFVDPGADATIGGMVATGASGTTSVRYGTMRENTLGLTVVLADGTIIHTGSRARKSSAGYDLTRLFVGSEGTLGVITEVSLRVHPLPNAVAGATCAFSSIAAAVDAVTVLLHGGLGLARIELVDDTMISAINAFCGLQLPVAATLFLELHGFSKDALSEQQAALEGMIDDVGGQLTGLASNAVERDRLWDARHRAFYAGLASRPGARGITTDACIPLSSLSSCISETLADVAGMGLSAPLVGHVGDGNFHLLLLVQPGNERELERARAIIVRLSDRAIAAGGTCSGEHGIGLGKIDSLAKMCGESINTMRAIKHALDPSCLFNPGKLFRDPTPSREARAV